MGLGNVVGNIQKQEGSENNSTGGQVNVEACKLSVSTNIRNTICIHQRHDTKLVMAPPISGPQAAPRFPTDWVSEIF